MKVLILHNDLRVYWKRRLIFLHSFLKSKGIDLYIVELFGKGSPYIFDSCNNIESWKDCLFPNNSYNELSKSEIKKVLFSKLSEINPDVIIAGSIVFYSGALGLRWAKNNHKKFIMFDDVKPSSLKRSFLVNRIKRLITNQIDALWLPSTDYDEEYSSLYSKKNIRFFYGFNCIDNQLFKLKDIKKFNNKKIICIARLVPIKNIPNLLSAWKFVEDNNDSNTLIILGDGPLSNELKDFAKSIKLNKVVFLGAIAHDKIPQYLFEADAFILPSWSESWGLVVNEAMAASLPVLLSNKINAAGTILKNGINGYSFNPGDVAEMQQKLIDFINLSDSDKEKMAANSLKIIGSLSYENMGNELLVTLNYLKSQPNKKPGLLANMAINLWSGGNNTSRWNSL